jgi:hypothetical protein
MASISSITTDQAIEGWRALITFSELRQGKPYGSPVVDQLTSKDGLQEFCAQSSAARHSANQLFFGLKKWPGGTRSARNNSCLLSL